MRRGLRGSGVVVDPDRVRRARQEAGLSLAQVARDDVSRTFLHFVEQGRSRPSPAVLSLIAKRTGRPVSYFVQPPTEQPESTTDLATDLIAVAGRIRQLLTESGLSQVDREAMKLLELTVRQGAQLARAIEEHPRKRSMPSRNRTSSRRRESVR